MLKIEERKNTTKIALKQLSDLIKKVEKNLNTSWKIFTNKIKANLRNEGESFDNYIENAIKVFKKYNQGSLSFTVTKLQQVGYRYEFAVIESIDSALISLIK